LVLADTLGLPSDTVGADSATATLVPLSVAAAQADVAAQERTLGLEQQSLFAAPSLMLGFQTGGPTGARPGTLPGIGLTLPFRLVNQNRGPVAVARANRDKAVAQLEIARRESAQQIAQASRERAGALARAGRGAQMIQSASRVTAMSRVAYTEGAA